MPSTYFSLILQTWATTAAKRAALLDQTDFPLRAENLPLEITFGQQLRLISNACRVLQPDWALLTGARLHPATHGANGVAAISAPTLRDAIHVLAQYCHLRAPHARMKVVEDGDTLRLVLLGRVALTDSERSALLDIVLLSLQGVIECVLGRPMSGARFELPQSAPEHAERYSELFHAPVRFGSREAAVVIPARWAKLQNPLADPTLHATMIRSLDAHARRLGGRKLLVARVDQLLTQHGPRLSLRSAARSLGLSARTLTRRLRAEGASYFALVDETRKAQAESLLSDPEITLAETAHALGYGDTASFGRAFRRWFAVPPGQYRKHYDRVVGR